MLPTVVLAGLCGICYAQPPPSALPLPSPQPSVPADWGVHRMGEAGGWSLEPGRGNGVISIITCIYSIYLSI